MRQGALRSQEGECVMNVLKGLVGPVLTLLVLVAGVYLTLVP